jgi:hypothetical protein
VGGQGWGRAGEEPVGRREAGRDRRGTVRRGGSASRVSLLLRTWRV